MFKHIARKIYLFSICSFMLMGCGTIFPSVSEKGSDIPNESSKNGPVNSENSSQETSNIEPYVDPSTGKTVIKKATIIEKGLRSYTDNQGKVVEESYYDLEEFAFEDVTYMYDGKEHFIYIKGMLPLGTRVQYSNNSLTAIGQKEATASIYDDSNNLLMTKKAIIKIVENKGFPEIRIDTKGKSITSKDVYVAMTLSTDNCDNAYKLTDIPGNIRLRGNGSLSYDKKPYRIKFDEKQNLLGLNNGSKMKNWVLLNDYTDQSMMRNLCAFHMGNALLNYSNNYSASYQHVHVYLNNSYIGVYLLTEQQQVNKNRVNINEPKENYTGNDIGYLVELDNYYSDADYSFSVAVEGSTRTGGGGWWGGGGGGESVNGVTIQQKGYSVKNDIYAQSQVNYISTYVNNVFNILKNAVKTKELFVINENNELVKSPYDNAFDTINSVIDLESMFKMYVLHELLKNIDVGWSSFYLFVDFSKDSTHKRFTFGAPWDFDWSQGNVNNSFVANTSGTYNDSGTNSMFNPWFYLLSQTDFFATNFRKYYKVFAQSSIYEDALEYINYETEAFKNDFGRNYEKWDNLGKVTPAYTPNEARNFKTHKDAVTHLTNWLNNRKSYMDSAYLK